ncbi:MAG TPA: hypothetical protein VLQ45_32510 [Thermoanaerobaculia bacterium]|nr:hypothetical protein [Thermoanaerobaculia bacterium]
MQEELKTLPGWQLTADEKAVDRVRESLELTPDVERHRTALDQHLTEMKKVRDQQNLHIANKQAASQQLARMLTDGRELATRLRRVAGANLGLKNEKLVQFGIAPIRKRSRKPVVLPPPQEGEGAGSGPPKPAA